MQSRRWLYGIAPVAIAGLLAVPALSQQVFPPTGPVELPPVPGKVIPHADRPPMVTLPPHLEAQLPRFEDIRPDPPAPIPDDPPPHRGARIDLPVTVHPPDLVVVEVLEALSGRPITGDRMVRPDGTITLGFYGDIHVRGLTIPQIKTKIILHLRQFLGDDILGIYGYDVEGQVILIPPEDSDRVFVDLGAYNSLIYFVQGDVAAPGRLPWTGNETLHDAINYAGGLAPTANPKDIQLIRPARGDQPAKIFPIDLEAIQREGDLSTDLQLFPDDRIYVGRHPVVVSTIEADRVVAPLNTAYNTILQAAATRQWFDIALEKRELTPEQRAELVRRMVDFSWEITRRGEGEPLDEAEYKRMIGMLLEESGP